MRDLFDLQLFAEEHAGDEPTAGNEEGEKPEKDTGGESTQKAGAKYTDEDLDKIIEKKFAKWKAQEKKAVDEAKKLAEMNATQKAEYERDQLQKELDGLKRKDALAEMTKTARKMLSDANISVSDELLSVMVTTDAEETKKAVDSFAEAFDKAVENAVKERLKGEAPRKGSGGSVKMTKEQIMAIQDTELRQQKMLENKELFNL